MTLAGKSRGKGAVATQVFTSALNCSTVMPVSVATRTFLRSFIESFAIASRLPESTVLKGSTFQGLISETSLRVLSTPESFEEIPTGKDGQRVNLSHA